MIKNILKKININLNNKSFPYTKYMEHKKCIFIHIPKTAGTSIISVLSNNKENRRMHLPWYVYQKANPSKYSKYYKFAFVRNPIDRAFSAYSYIIGGGNGKVDLERKKKFDKFQDFNDFVINGLGKGRFLNMPFFLPQTHFILDFEENLTVDFLGKVENMNEDYHVIAEKLNLPQELPKKNIRSKNQQKFSINKEAINILQQIYNQDYLFLDYDKNDLGNNLILLKN